MRNVVIIGGGFGGLTTARALRGAPVKVTLIDRRNHHLFQPLLYQVATAGLSPADIAAPIRSVLRRQPNAEVLMGEVTGIDRAGRRVLIGERAVEYDDLVVATGSRHSYFAHPEWEAFAPGLKSIDDATRVRRMVLLAFERAEMESDPARRRAELTFVMVGGGPTGVEMAGAVAELAHRALRSDFRHIEPGTARILLVEAGPRLLNAFPESLSSKARRYLERRGVEIRVGARVDRVDAGSVSLGGERIATRTVFWAAGVQASPAGRWLDAATDRAGRVQVEPDLTVPGLPEIFVIGDTATLAQDGQPLPGLAPVAMQQGRYVARVIRARAVGAPPPAPFRYRDKGNLATVGRSFAIADLGKIRLSGFVAWVAWLLVHIYYLIGFRNRLFVLMGWAWAYLTFQRGARLITPER